MYKNDMDELTTQKVSWFMTTQENHWLWHKKCDHINLRLLFGFVIQRQSSM